MDGVTTQVVDLALRAAAVAQLLFLAALLLKDQGRSYAGALGAVLAVGVAAYLLCPLFYDDWGLSVWKVPLPYLLCVGNPVFFWLLSRAIFDDRFRLRPLHGLVLLMVVAVSYWHRDPYLPPVGSEIAAHLKPVVAVLPQFIALAIVIVALVQAYAGRGLDLIAARRKFRDVFIALTGGYMVLVLASEIYLRAQRPAAPVDILNVAAILAIAFGVSLALVRLRPGTLFEPRRPKLGDDELEATDRGLLNRLTHLVEAEHAYREEGLTIARLAERLGAQEYRLRRLINARLGFRNFNEFVNHHRVREVCERFHDPEAARLPVLTIAMDAGYRSLGPFNRAFKEQTGMTPTEYRAAQGSDPPVTD